MRFSAEREKRRCRKGSSSAEQSGLEAERRTAQEIFVPGAGVGDFRGDFVELRLIKFDDRAGAIFVTGLSEIERAIGVFDQMRGDAEPLESVTRVEPCDANVADGSIFSIEQLRIGSASPQFSFLLAGGVKAAGEQRHIERQAGGSV